MTKKFKKRSLSESNVAEKSENKDTFDVPVSPKKQKVETVSNAQNNAVSKKVKKGTQGDANTNKKKQEKNKNENNVKKVTPNAPVKQKEENQNDQKQEGSLNRKERNILKKAENVKLSKEKRKLFRREEGQVQTKTARFSTEEIKEKVKELESREQLSKTAKRKLASFKKCLQIREGTSDEPQNTATKEINNTNTPATTNSGLIAKKQNKKRSLEDVSVDNKIGKKAKPGKTTKSANENDAKKQKNVELQQGSLLRVKSKEDDDEDDEESNEEEEIENQVKPAKKTNKENVEEEENEDDDEDDDEGDEDEDEDDKEEEDENEVTDEDEDDEDEDEDEDEDVDDHEENEDDEEESESEDVGEKAKNKETKDAAKKKGNDIANSKKKRYVVCVKNIPYSATVDQIKSHFLSKVSKIVDVRIPKKIGTNKPRGFCYVELENKEDYENALSLNHSFVDKRRIIVEYSVGSQHTNAKQIIVAKNKKLDALRKEGKLAGSKKKTDKKGKKGKQNAVSSTA